MTLFPCGVLSRGLLQGVPGRQCVFKGLNFRFERFSTNLGQRKLNKLSLKYLAAGVPVTALGASYYYYKFKQNDSKFSNESGIYENLVKSYALLQSKPDVPIARKFLGTASDQTNLDLVLFQYPTCPFCCKVRAFLDYYGLPYEVVEVDPVLRQQTKWTTYRKVPILLAKVEGGYQQLNDSTMIISALKSYLLKVGQDLKDIVSFYPVIEVKNDNGEVKDEILNKYSLMYQDSLPKNKSSDSILEEKHWREWADKNLVHMLSPNVYRTLKESMQAFLWFSEVGEWDRLFPAWERNIIVYVGAMAMWIIGKRLKKRHHLLEDERESLYLECRKWMKALSKKNTTFMGGSTPNLADLAVYGVLSSIEGCLAFNDLLENTKIGDWYFATKQAVNSHAGKSEIIPLSTYNAGMKTEIVYRSYTENAYFSPKNQISA